MQPSPSAETSSVPSLRRALTTGCFAGALAALRGHLPSSGYGFEVEFRKPVRLPSEVVLSATEAGGEGELRLDGHGELLHMVGRWGGL